MTIRMRLGLVACTVLAAGCAAPRQAGEDGTDREYRALLRAAGPSRALPDWPPPPGVPAELASPMKPADPGYAAATMGLDATIDELAAKEVAPAASGGAASPAQDGQNALRLYISGREKLIGGDVAGAVRDLQGATKLDPASPEPWRELGTALRATGNDPEAFRAFEAAASRGLKEAPGLEYLGRVRQERTESMGEPAAVAFAHAWVLGPRASDPGLPAVLLGGLARSLMQIERWTAAREAIEVSLRELDRVSGPSRYGQDLADMARRRGVMWRNAGDAACRVGDYAAAMRAYQRAAEFPSIEELGITPRLVFSATRAEGPAAGAAYLIDAARTGGGLSAGDVDLLRLLASDGPTRSRVTAALTALRDSARAPRARGEYTRALAAVQPPDRALRALLAEAVAHPGDHATLRELARPEYGQAGVDAAVEVVSRHPLAASRVAQALYVARPDVDATLAALPDGDAAGLLRVYLEAQRGRLESALREAESLRGGGATGDAVILARVTALASLGRWDDAESQVSTLDPARSDESRRAAALGLLAMQRNGAAMRVLEPLLPRADEGDLLLAAELALAGRQTPEDLDRAESWLRRVLEIDPSSDRAHGLLLAMYSSSGPRADEAKLSAAVRDLRESAEGGRLLTMLRAQEFLRRGGVREAEGVLLELARANPTDEEVLNLLASVWEQPSPRGGEHAVDPVPWLTDRHAERPSDPVLTTALARVLVAAGKADEAESLVRERLAAGDDPRLGATLEAVLRKRAGGDEEADRLALARLEPLPRSIDSSLDLAELYTRLDRAADAERVLIRDIPASATLRDGQTPRLVGIAGAFAQNARNNPTDANKSAARSLLDALVQQVEVSSDLHLMRLSLMAEDPAVTQDQLEAAIQVVRERYPPWEAMALRFASNPLLSSGRTEMAARLVEGAAARAGASADVFLTWAGLVAKSGAADDAKRLIERAAEAGQLDAFVSQLTGGAATVKSTKAEAAYQIGLQSGGLGRRAEAEAMYELALKFDPRHAWASNNLGYALADRGEDLERAERLLETAYAGLPGEGSILDSLAWVRYRRGEVADAKDASGNTKAGALSLLQRAYQTRGGRESPVVLDHFADTLYSQGRKDEARRVWGESLRAVGQRLRAMNALPADDPNRREMLDVQKKVRAKLEAVRGGQEVPYDAPGTVPGVDPGTGGSAESPPKPESGSP